MKGPLPVIEPRTVRLGSGT